jgi:outer membrane protein OmpA-like peptidoglycan-associated protein
MIEGHTDSMGGDDYNLALSQRRAEAVSNALIARGIPAGRVQTHGLGKTFPVATNDSASGRQQNRRVEVIFSDDKGQFPQAAERLTRS